MGVEAKDVSELRFQCTSENKKQFIHFKTSNRDLIEVALTGFQNGTTVWI